MKRMVTVVLVLMFGAAASCAQDNPVKMQASGSELTTAFNLQANTIAGEEILTGRGSLGSFTYLGLRADNIITITVTDACPQGNITVTGGAGIFRFSDGSLLAANITGGIHLHRC
jgi:hypothetical protein